MSDFKKNFSKVKIHSNAVDRYLTVSWRDHSIFQTLNHSTNGGQHSGQDGIFIIFPAGDPASRSKSAISRSD
jgi:hypothetical protein